jgi:hypothetical protein
VVVEEASKKVESFVFILPLLPRMSPGREVVSPSCPGLGQTRALVLGSRDIVQRRRQHVLRPRVAQRRPRLGWDWRDGGSRVESDVT